MLDADPALREWIAPRPVPFVVLNGNEARVPGRRPTTVSDSEAAVLARCDGVRPARDIAADLPGTDVARTLHDLVARRWVTWRLEVPAGTHPERALRDWLSTVGDPDLRRRGLDALDLLERGRAKVAAATDETTLLTALQDLERDFTALTDTAATREKSASTAPCRALVYSDTRRSATARLGPAVVEALSPLRLLMDSAGWLTARLAAVVETEIRTVHHRLAAGRRPGRPGLLLVRVPARAARHRPYGGERGAAGVRRALAADPRGPGRRAQGHPAGRRHRGVRAAGVRGRRGAGRRPAISARTS